MTEIGNRSSRSRGGAKKGVKVERIYTTPGVHPYDEVTWEHRDVVQQNWRTGETIFEQRDQLADILETSPSLRGYFREQIGKRYAAARLLAAQETGIAFGLFPEECPFSPDQVLDLRFFPEDREIE